MDRKTLIAAAAVLLLCVAAVFAAGHLPQGVPGTQAEGGATTAPGRADAADGVHGSGESGAPGERWPGQSLGYIGPNGEGIPKPEDFETAEEYQYAIVETSEVEWSWDDYPYIVNEDGVKYRDGAVEVDMYRSYGEARCHEVIEEMGGLWLDDVFAWDAGLDTATVYVGFPRGTDVFKVAEELEALPEVDHANPFIYTRIDSTTELVAEAVGANDIQASGQTYLQVSHFIGAWLNSTGDREVTVAVIDTGIDLDHPDLAANIDYLRAYNAAGDARLIPLGADPDDYGLVDSERENHGSGVSGVVSAVTNNAIGISGASYNAYVLPICAFGLSSDDNGTGFQWEYVRRALYYLTQLQDKPAAVNMSFAGEAFDTSTRKSEIEALVAQLRAAKCVCIASAGNYDTGDVNSPSADAVLYPAACEGVVSVAGLDPTGTERWRATYDVNKECGSVYNEYVDICAPAENVFTVVNPDLPFKGQSVACGVQYAYQSGTSFSAPQVTAAAALIKRLQPDWDASQVEGALLGNVRR